MKLIVIEGLLLGAIGASIGIVIASVAALLISAVGIPMPPPPNMESGYTARVALTLTAVLQAFGIGVVSATLASILPGLRFLRVSMPDALRRAV